MTDYASMHKARLALMGSKAKRLDRPARGRASGKSARPSAQAIRAAWKRGFANPM